jgi:predicted component of type VI protein secretion system
VQKNEKRIDWDKIRAEYISGGIGQRKLAEKYGVKYTALRFHADGEGWTAEREAARQKAIKITTQKTAEAAADNAAIAQGIKRKLLLLLDRKTDELVKEMLAGTTIRKSETENTFDDHGNIVKVTDSQTEHKIRDLTAAYKDLTADMQQQTSANNELLQSLYELERGNGS